ncbi:hypothetical protein ABN034_33895 [Actinopolymorpha sp. B11F2]|uniref:hypothetical protein n=1 Tax=Actinopolymorpha sp. B11F2 TaxID=3160862 RepID=UPI0032E39D9C
MHVMIRRYQMTGTMEDLIKRVDALFARQLSGADRSTTSAPVQVPSGILGYQAVQTGEDTLLTITTFSSERHLQKAQEGAAAIRASLTDFLVEEIETFAGEVKINRINEQLLTPVGPHDDDT